MVDSAPQAEEVDEDFWATAAASQESGADTQGYDDCESLRSCRLTD